MPKDLEPNSKQTKDADNNIVEPSTFLETEKEHKDWYDVTQMGKQRGTPKRVPVEGKKEKGNRKHSLRKEK